MKSGKEAQPQPGTRPGVLTASLAERDLVGMLLPGRTGTAGVEQSRRVTSSRAKCAEDNLRWKTWGGGAAAPWVEPETVPARNLRCSFCQGRAFSLTIVGLAKVGFEKSLKAEVLKELCSSL